MAGKTAQRKGAAGERELAAILQEYGYDCIRGGSLSFGEVPDLSGLPGIHIEVKRVEKLNVVEAMEQSIRDSERMQDGIPTLFHRRNRKPWLVTMRLVDWLELYQQKKS
jgi:Holliday junction resolvase